MLALLLCLMLDWSWAGFAANSAKPAPKAAAPIAPPPVVVAPKAEPPAPPAETTGPPVTWHMSDRFGQAWQCDSKADLERWIFSRNSYAPMVWPKTMSPCRDGRCPVR